MILRWINLQGGLNDNVFNFELLAEVGSSLEKVFSGGAVFEPEITWPILRLLRKGDIFIDVGANVGYFTFMAANCVGPSGHVLAFEPGPNVLGWLGENIKHNACGNITLISEPASNVAGEEVAFYLHQGASMGNALYDPRLIGSDQSEQPRSVQAVTTTIDAEFARLGFPGRLAVIKVDVEGAELKVLQGAARTIKEHRPLAVFAEWHPRGLEQMGGSLDEMRAFMGGLGYWTWWPQKDGGMPILMPPETALKLPAEIMPSNPVVNLMFAPIHVVGQMYPAMEFTYRLAEEPYA